MVLVAAGAALLSAALAGVLWLILGHNRGQNLGSPPNGGTTPITSSTIAEQTTTESTTTTSQPRISGLTGTDGLGFIGYPAAQCNPGSEPAAEVRTTQSLIVICQTGPGSFYYRGLRLSDGAGIVLANAVRSSAGFDVANPTDGTRYQIRPNVVNIVSPDGQVSSEPVLQHPRTRLRPKALC